MEVVHEGSLLGFGSEILNAKSQPHLGIALSPLTPSQASIQFNNRNSSNSAAPV